MTHIRNAGLGEREDDGAGRLVVTVESAPAPMGCPSCGVFVGSHGRRDVVLAEKLTERQLAGLERAITADERHDAVYIAYQCGQLLR